MKKIICLLLCVCMTLSLFTGCRAEDPESYVPTGDALAMEEEEEIRQVVDDGTQSFSLAYHPDMGLDPINCTNYTNRLIFPLVYQSLFSVDRDNNLIPMLCESYTVSADLRTYELTLNSKATFSDGTPVTADIVVANLHAAASSPYYSGRMTHMQAIYATEDGKVVIALTQACDSLPTLLDMPIVLWKENQEYALGTGPYVFGGKEGNRYLTRRKNWWCTSNDLLITAQKIPLKEAQTIVDVRDYFEFDDVGVVCTDPGSDRYTEYRCDYELWDCETGIFVYIGFNLYGQLFQNTAIRQAIVKAIDRKDLADRFYRGFAFPSELPVSPNSKYYSATLAQKYAYDEQEFLNIMAANGVQGRTVRLLVNADDTLRVSVAQEIANKLSASGMIVTVDARVNDAYKMALASGDYDMYLGQTKLSPNMDLTPFFSANGVLSYGGIATISMYNLCLQALENEGNYYTFCQAIMDEAMICPILFRGYAVYATRGLMTDLKPARDNLFCYTIQ